LSFSSQVKEELAKLTPANPCCAKAEAYGLLECGRTFSPSSVSFQTENTVVSQWYRSLLPAVCGLQESDCLEARGSSGVHIISIESPDQRLRVREHFGHSPQEVSVRLNRANLDCEECPAAYLRGAFLACGAVSNPNMDYHIEFSIPLYHLSRDLQTLMRELGFNARLVQRKGSNIIYLKESGQIEDCLTLMGATNSSLEMMGVKMVKDIRNVANRIANCESANIDKTVTAAMAQIRAIRKIEKRQGLNFLPQELRELAQLRLDNPDLSLRELGEMLSVPLSRSGVNHRLKRIMELAEEV
jgi:DNA-binding protein WhiA